MARLLSLQTVVQKDQSVHILDAGLGREPPPPSQSS